MRMHQSLTALAVAAMLAPGLAAAETRRFEHRFDARPGATVVVDVSIHEVEVTARPGATVDVEVVLDSSSEKLLKQYEPRFEESAGKLLIRSVSEETSWFGNGRIEGRVTVAMPPGMSLLVDSSSGSTRVTGDFGAASLTFDCSSGSVTVDGAADEVDVDASSGSVKVRLGRPARRVSADVSSGSVNVNGPVAEARVDASSGSITVDGLIGSASLDSSSGSISARWAQGPPAGTAVRADASSGSVRLTFPRGTVLAGTADTGSGTIRTDFPGNLNDDRDHLVLAGGPGAVEVSVDTSSGSVTLEAE
jgi:DUF4097 and DUF4098 domain-containing protein YvlB